MGLAASCGALLHRVVHWLQLWWHSISIVHASKQIDLVVMALVLVEIVMTPLIVEIVEIVMIEMATLARPLAKHHHHMAYC